MLRVTIVVYLIFVSFALLAQPGDPGDPTNPVPITGIEVLIGIGASLGLGKFLKSKKDK